MLLLICVIYIVLFSHRALCRLSPVLRAIESGREMPVPRVSVLFCGATVLSVIAWAYVISETLEVLYV